MGVNSLPKTVTRQHRGCNLNPGPFVLESSMLISRLPSHPEEHTRPFNGPFSGTTQVSRYQKGKTNLDFTEARDGEWTWHQLGHMQVCILLQTDNHTSTPPLRRRAVKYMWTPISPHRKWRLDQFCCFSRAHAGDQQTDTQAMPQWRGAWVVEGRSSGPSRSR